MRTRRGALSALAVTCALGCAARQPAPASSALVEAVASPEAPALRVHVTPVPLPEMPRRVAEAEDFYVAGGLRVVLEEGRVRIARQSLSKRIAHAQRVVGGWVFVLPHQVYFAERFDGPLTLVDERPFHLAPQPSEGRLLVLGAGQLWVSDGRDGLELVPGLAAHHLVRASANVDGVLVALDAADEVWAGTAEGPWQRAPEARTRLHSRLASDSMAVVEPGDEDYEVLVDGLVRVMPGGAWRSGVELPEGLLLTSDVDDITRLHSAGGSVRRIELPCPAYPVGLVVSCRGLADEIEPHVLATDHTWYRLALPAGAEVYAEPTWTIGPEGRMVHVRFDDPMLETPLHVLVDRDRESTWTLHVQGTLVNYGARHAYEARDGAVYRHSPGAVAERIELPEDEAYVYPDEAAGVIARVRKASGFAFFHVTADGERVAMPTAPPDAHELLRLPHGFLLALSPRGGLVRPPDESRWTVLDAQGLSSDHNVTMHFDGSFRTRLPERGLHRITVSAEPIDHQVTIAGYRAPEERPGPEWSCVRTERTRTFPTRRAQVTWGERDGELQWRPGGRRPVTVPITQRFRPYDRPAGARDELLLIEPVDGVALSTPGPEGHLDALLLISRDHAIAPPLTLLPRDGGLFGLTPSLGGTTLVRIEPSGAPRPLVSSNESIDTVVIVEHGDRIGMGIISEGLNAGEEIIRWHDSSGPGEPLTIAVDDMSGHTLCGSHDPLAPRVHIRYRWVPGMRASPGTVELEVQRGGACVSGVIGSNAWGELRAHEGMLEGFWPNGDALEERRCVPEDASPELTERLLAGETHPVR